MKLITLRLNENEAQVLTQLIDTAVKAKGIEVAEAGLFFYRKIQTELEAGDGIPNEVSDE